MLQIEDALKHTVAKGEGESADGPVHKAGGPDGLMVLTGERERETYSVLQRL